MSPSTTWKKADSESPTSPRIQRTYTDEDFNGRGAPSRQLTEILHKEGEEPQLPRYPLLPRENSFPHATNPSSFLETLEPVHPLFGTQPGGHPYFGKIRAAGASANVYCVPSAIEGEGPYVIKAFKRGHEEAWEHEYSTVEDILETLGAYHPNMVKYRGASRYIANPENPDEAIETEPFIIYDLVPGSNVSPDPTLSLGPTLRTLVEGPLKKLEPAERLQFGKFFIKGVVTFFDALNLKGYSHNDPHDKNIIFDLIRLCSVVSDFNMASRHNQPKAAGTSFYSPWERLGADPLVRPPESSEERWNEDVQDMEHHLNLLHIGAQETNRDGKHVRQRSLESPVSPTLLSVRPEEMLESPTDSPYKNRQNVNHKTDPFSVGQLLHYLVEGHIFSAVDLSWNLKNGDINGAMRAVKFSSDAFKRRGGQVFRPADQTDELKKISGYYEFVNWSMALQGPRMTAGEQLDHRFLTENLPTVEEIETMVVKMGLAQPL